MMRKNIIQSGKKSADGFIHIEFDWFEKGIPGNVHLAEDVYIDTSYGFAAFHSTQKEAMSMGKGSGCYDRATFIVGTNGKIEIGEFNILNGTTFYCHNKISVGNHCMFAWGSLITDIGWEQMGSSVVHRRNKMLQSASDINRLPPFSGVPNPVIIEDNVWVGFDAVILPGVRLGRGCVIGSKTIIHQDVPPYAIMIGNPARIIRFLDANDTEESKALAMQQFLGHVNE